MVTIYGDKIVTPFRILNKGYIGCEGDKITEVNAEKPGNMSKVIDLSGLYVAPGFIDLHTHGGGGYEFWSKEPEDARKAAKFHGRYGVTSVVPTVNFIDAVELTEDIKARFDCFRMVQQTKEACPEFLGLHLEGPNTSPGRKVLPEQLVHPADLDGYLKLIRYSGNILRWTMAPEVDGVMEIISEISKYGVYVSIGHADPTFGQVYEASERGATHVTHIYSGMNSVYRKEGKRFGGLLEAAFLLDKLDVEMIANGSHLAPEILQLIYKVKGADHICIVSDATSMSGHPEGPAVYKGKEVTIQDGIILNETKSGFYGSAITFDRMLYQLVYKAGIPMTDAVRMCTSTPARSVGLGNRKGILAEGYDADIIAYDADINVKFVMTRGKILYQDL